MAKRIRSSSFFGDLSSREIHGLKVANTRYPTDLSSDLGGSGNGVLSVEHQGNTTPPLSLSFCKTTGNSHLLSVSDENGFVSLYDTRRNLPSYASCREKPDQARICEWIAHNNSIFDMCWIKDGAKILTGSGDQTIKIWNAEYRKCLGVLVGHTGSVKSLCSHSSNSEILVSGSRDGSFALWDLRCKPQSPNNRGDIQLMSSAVVKDAHNITKGKKRTRKGKAASVSITSVLYLKDEISIASSGASDSVVKFWDTRNLKSCFSQASPQAEERAQHGISCLSQDSNGAFIVASCMDHRIYLYSTLQSNKGPAKVFSGSKIESFFVKSKISLDGTHILGGSSDGDAYIWQVERPDKAPITLKGHEGEVTAVDWCTSEVGKIATSADDFMVRVWNITNRSHTDNTVSPTTVRKRITAPNIAHKRLFTDNPTDEPTKITKHTDTDTRPFISNQIQVNPPSPEINGPDLSTPESRKKRTFLQKSPESELTSPSSVLNPPPSSKKKTIRDYFSGTL